MVIGTHLSLYPNGHRDSNSEAFENRRGATAATFCRFATNFVASQLRRSPGGGIGRRVGLKHQWETVPVRSRPWVLNFRSIFFNPNVKERRCKAMIIVPVKEGENIERAIKKFKRKFDKTGVVKELRRRQQFDKPSELKRVKMAHAKYVQSLHAHDDK